MRFTLTLCMFLFARVAMCQELFTWSEPASNMAARSVGFRITNNLMHDRSGNKWNYHALPEAMIGVSAKLMLHAEGFLSTRNARFTGEGGALLLKYRFLSFDEVHSHFRLATYMRGVINNSDVHQEAIDLNGHNSGYEIGIIATQLKNKIAVSAGAGFLHATDNAGNNKFFPGAKARNAFVWNLAVGKLMLPKEYTSYDQINLNLMLEFLGQYNPGRNKAWIDAAPTVQLIFKSRMRVDMGYRFAMLTPLKRTASNGFLVRLEYNIFSAY